MFQSLRQLRGRLIGIGHTGDFCRSLHFRRFLRGRTVGSALDAGCGDGWYSLYLAVEMRAHVHAFDLSRRRAADLQVHAGSLPVAPFVGDLVHRAFTGEYDLVVCVDVLEHITDVEAAALNLCGAVRPGGILFVHVPRDRHRSLTGLHVRDPRHVWEGFSLPRLREILEAGGLQIVRSAHSFGPLASVAWELERRLGAGGRLEKLLLSVAFPALKAAIWLDALGDHPRGNGLCVVAEKPGTAVPGPVEPSEP